MTKEKLGMTQIICKSVVVRLRLVRMIQGCVYYWIVMKMPSRLNGWLYFHCRWFWSHLVSWAGFYAYTEPPRFRKPGR